MKCSCPAGSIGIQQINRRDNTTWCRYTESDRKLAFRVIQEPLEAGSLPPCHLTWSLKERWLDLPFTTGGRQRPDHGSQLPLTPLMFWSLFSSSSLWSQDEMVNFSPIFQNDSRLRLFSLWSAPLRLAFRCQISLWPALKSFGREFPEGRLHFIWVREERRWWERWEHREQPTAWPSSWKWLWIRQKPAFLPLSHY